MKKHTVCPKTCSYRRVAWLLVVPLAAGPSPALVAAEPPAPAPPRRADAGLRKWALERPTVHRSVEVKTLAECRAAVARPNTHVRLAADIDAGGENVFDIKASHVLIDGGGHAIKNAKYAVYSDNKVRHHIEVRHLKIQGARVGIHIRRDRHVQVHRNTAAGCKDKGIFFENSFGSHGRYFEVHHNKVTGGGQGCIVFQDGCTDGRVYENECADGGYRPQSYANGCLNFDSNMIRVEVYRNRIRGGTYGLAIRGQNNEGMHDCLIRENVIAKAKAAGIRICYHTFRNVLRNNTVRDCPVGVYYQLAYKVHSNLLDGITIENCPLPVRVEGWPLKAAPARAAAPRRTAPRPPTTGNVDRLVLRNWKGSGPAVKITGNVKDHIVADAGRWQAGAAQIEGPARLTWASYVQVRVTAGGKPVSGAAIGCGPHRATTGREGRARLGPFPAMEISQEDAKRVARTWALEAAAGGRKAVARFTPDGSAVSLKLALE